VVAIREASGGEERQVKSASARSHPRSRRTVVVEPGGPALSATQTSIAVLHPAVSASFIESAGMATREVPDG